MSSVVISGDTSGAITLAAPAVSGTNTATLPAATGTVMVSGNMPAFSAYPSGTQNVTATTWTKVTLDTEEFDTNSNFASNRFTPTVAGYYQISGAVLCTSTSVNPTGVGSAIYKNGSSYKASTLYTGTTLIGSATVSAIVYLNGSTDYVELYGRVQGGAGDQFAGGIDQTYFTGSMVRGA
jgi:hypothetical protein